MDANVPEVIPDSCENCKYFKQTGFVDKFKGYCNFYNENTYSTFKCLALSLSKGSNIPIESLEGKTPLDSVSDKAPKARPPSGSESEIKTAANVEEEIEGIKGWLMFFVIGRLVFDPFGIIIVIILTLQNQLESYNKASAVYFTLTFAALFVWSIYVGVIILNRKRHAVQNAKLYLLASAVVLICLNPSFISNIGIFISLIIWYQYLLRSKRVAMNFPIEKDVKIINPIIDPNCQYSFNWYALILLVISQFAFQILAYKFNFQETYLYLLKYKLVISGPILINVLFVFFLYHNKLSNIVNSLFYSILTFTITASNIIIGHSIALKMRVSDILHVIKTQSETYDSNTELYSLQMHFEIPLILSNLICSFVMIYLLRFYYRKDESLFKPYLIALIVSLLFDRFGIFIWFLLDGLGVNTEGIELNYINAVLYHAFNMSALIFGMYLFIKKSSQRFCGNEKLDVLKTKM